MQKPYIIILPVDYMLVAFEGMFVHCVHSRPSKAEEEKIRGI